MIFETDKRFIEKRYVGREVDRGNGCAVGDPFRWRTATGFMLPPKEMFSKHLFYTWLMIWNHAVPDESMRVWGDHRYWFTPFYTPKYMLRAFRECYFELKQRTDLGPRMLEAVARIEAMARELRVYEQYELSGPVLAEGDGDGRNVSVLRRASQATHE